MTEQGHALQAQISIDGFTPSSNYPTIYTANTRELYNGAYVVFGMGHGGLSGWALRVTDLVQNTSFRVKLPFRSSTESVSSPQTAFPAGISSPFAGAPDMGPDGGWHKTPSLTMWIDDFKGNRCPGSRRVIGLRKQASTPENFQWACPAEKVGKFLGREIVFAARQWMKAAAGSGRARLFINDHINPPSFSPFFTGPSFTDPIYHGYEMGQVSQVIHPDCTVLHIGIEIHGASGDVIYFALPKACPGSSLTANDLGDEDGEMIVVETHFNPPSLAPCAMTFPSDEMIPGSGLYGFTDLDLQGLSYCQMHGSVSAVTAKLEFTSPIVGQTVFAAALDVPNVQLTFGPQCATQVANVMYSSDDSMMPLKLGQPSAGNAPGCFAFFSSIRGGYFSNATFDFGSVIS